MEKRHPLTIGLALAGAVACGSLRSEPAVPIVQPGAPGEPGRVITAQQASNLSQVRDTAADVQFMQGMIGHHLQAIEMTVLLTERTADDNLRLLAKRIELSQADEIEMMRDWLRARGAQLPDPHAHHAPGATLMPGMLTVEEMQRLVEAKGAEFDSLFLELMIKHHAGALVMVEQLFSTAGAGQQSSIFAFASDVEADQRMEIERMSAMLREHQR